MYRSRRHLTAYNRNNVNNRYGTRGYGHGSYESMDEMYNSYFPGAEEYDRPEGYGRTRMSPQRFNAEQWDYVHDTRYRRARPHHMQMYAGRPVRTINDAYRTRHHPWFYGDSNINPDPRWREHSHDYPRARFGHRGHDPHMMRPYSPYEQDWYNEM